MRRFFIVLLFGSTFICCQQEKSEVKDSVAKVLETNTSDSLKIVDEQRIGLPQIDLPLDTLRLHYPEVYAFVKKFERHVSKKEWSSLTTMYEQEAYNIQKKEFRMSDAQFLYELLNLSQWNINDESLIYPDRIFTTISEIDGLEISKYSVFAEGENCLRFEFYGNLTSKSTSLTVELGILKTPEDIFILSGIG